ncbi:MAG: response regulator transcription factor [Bacteroidetes bacterium]|nr:response regulator transcription factor [Bacteroidota bacterium]MBS1973854.1 response regulator transcription factor [Bacteroidota bacterium]
MIRAVIIDDEKNCRDTLQWQLSKYCPKIEVIANAENAITAIEMINQKKPQLIFLDVEMPGKNGFEMLEELKEIDFDIIFTTAFEQYAIRAIKFGALDYLVKPIDKDELMVAMARIREHSRHTSIEQVKTLLDYLKKHKDFPLQKIALPMLHGYELVSIANIVSCESNSNYTNIRLSNGQQLLVSRTLKEIEELLNMHPFFRVHHSFLVNLTYAIRYVKGEGGSLILSDNITIPVARSKKEALLKLIAPMLL